MTSENRAPAGGTIGINGEQYSGGQFLPSSESTVKGAQTRKGKKSTGKREIAPYIWEVQPFENAYSLFWLLSRYFSDNRQQCKYEKGVGLVGFQFTEIYNNFEIETAYQHGTIERRQRTEEEIEKFRNELIAFRDEYNSGVRWIESK